MSFSMPIDTMWSLGILVDMSALPSLVHTTTSPVSAMPKLAPVMPALQPRHKLLAQVHAGHVGEEGGVVGVGRVGSSGNLVTGNLLTEAVAYLLTMDVEGRHDDVAGCQLHHLQDALAQVGLHHVDALLLQVLVQVALLGEHALALHHLFHLVVMQDV